MQADTQPGYECEFTEQLPNFVRSSCPVCLLVLREPHQVTCCGKSFCKACIERVMKSNTLCPACKQDNFSIYPDKGLEQELYSFRVYCSHRSEGCDWQGELGRMCGHLNSDPDYDEQLEGCAFTRVMCVYCSVMLYRFEIGSHQISDCLERPFTCSMCEKYDSTYEDVMGNHAPECKCRPVECPNTCGVKNLQHQHLEEHVSIQCPLSYVECEFSDAGCDAKVYRKDLSSHLSSNMLQHISLLACENKKLKTQLRNQTEELTCLVQTKAAKEKKRFKSLLKSQASFIESVKSGILKPSTVKKSGKRLGNMHTVKKNTVKKKSRH